MTIHICRLCLSLEDMILKEEGTGSTNISPPQRSSPWTLKAGNQPQLFLLLERLYQELLWGILYLSSVRFTILLCISLENSFLRRKDLYYFWYWRNSGIRPDKRHVEPCREDEDTEILASSCSSWWRLSALPLILQLIRNQTDNALQD